MSRFNWGDSICENLRAYSAKICGKNFQYNKSKITRPFLCALASLREIVVAAFSIILVSCGGQDSENADYINPDSLYLIPEPVLIEKREGSFKISNDTYLSYSNDLNNEGLYIGNLIDSVSGF
ncbi:MAG: hypothetical protein IPM77_11225 [Crocinitomicaceae bacterium]|nr:hypothetical protein [Crocinitomicaceae bacterium]